MDERLWCNAAGESGGKCGHYRRILQRTERRIATAAAAFLALLLTWRTTKNALRKTQELADRDRAATERIEEATEARAQRAENAAALTNDALGRIADILKNQPSAGLTARAWIASGKVSWSLIHSRGDRYCLENTGDASACAVEVYGHETLIGPMDVEGGPDLGSGEALTLMALRAGQTTDSTITVTWQSGPGDDQKRMKWRYPLPPKG